LPLRGVEKIVAELEAYCDESGIDDKARACVVSGFVGTSSKWQRFEEAWFSASGGVRFHGKQFFARDHSGQRVKPYKGWSDSQASEYLDRLLAVIELRLATPIGAVISIDAFNGLSVGEKQYLTGAAYSHRKRKFTFTGTTKPYHFGFMLCVLQAVSCIKKSGWSVDFVFDQQSEFSKYAVKLFTRAKEKAAIRNSLGSLAFVDSQHVGGLQAADLLSHVCFRREKTPVLDHVLLDSITLRLKPIVGRRIANFDKTGIEQWMSDIPSDLREEWRSSSPAKK
jgi:hypothetical protein